MFKKVERLLARTESSELFACAAGILSIPREPTEALVVFPGMGEDERVIHAVRRWRDGDFKYLFVAGINLTGCLLVLAAELSDRHGIGESARECSAVPDHDGRQDARRGKYLLGLQDFWRTSRGSVDDDAVGPAGRDRKFD